MPIRITQKFVATAILVLLIVACSNPTNAVSVSGTTVTISGDSEWQIPSGFTVIPPPTREQTDAMLSKDVGPPPDLPAFSMTRESKVDGEDNSVLIAVWTDGISTNADPREVLISWTENGIRLAEYDAVVVNNRAGIQVATWRGQAQSYHRYDQNLTMGMIATAIYHPESQRVWRLSCLTTSEKMSDEVARICGQLEAEFRPL